MFLLIYLFNNSWYAFGYNKFGQLGAMEEKNNSKRKIDEISSLERTSGENGNELEKEKGRDKEIIILSPTITETKQKIKNIFAGGWSSSILF